MTQKIRVHLINGQTLDVDVDDSINFGGLCASIRETGRWLDQNFCIPADKIAIILKLDATGSLVNPIVVHGTMQ